MTSAVVLCTAGYDRTIRFWEALSGICSRTLQHPDSQINRLAISADKRYLAAAGNPHCRIYEALTTNGNPIASLEGHTSNVTAVAFQQSNKWVVTASEDGSIKIWDLRTRGPQRDYQHKHPVNDVVIHPNQGELISWYVIELATEGLMASSDQNGSIKIWDLAGNACTHELVPEEDAPVRSVSVATDGSVIVAGNNRGNVYVWKMSSMNSGANVEESTWDLQPLTRIQAHNKYLLRSILSPDGRFIATASSDSSIKLWNLSGLNGRTGINLPAAAPNVRGRKEESFNGVTLERTLTGHQRWVWDCAFSADSEYLVSAASDHTARLWDLSNGETIRQYQGHHKAAVSVALNDYSM